MGADSKDAFAKSDAEQSIPDVPIPLQDQVDFLAEEVLYDEINEIVTALRNVELVQNGRILKAETVSYDLKQDRVTAKGNVILNETTGDIYFADELTLSEGMKNGFVAGLKGILADGSRFTAKDAEKIEDLKVILSEATYTACEPCKADPSKAPIWAIKADKVTHHKDENRISYDDATFEVSGVPVAYLPYFSHPDGSVEQKSGFLTPSVGYDSDLGAFYRQEYYWGLGPDRDATIGAQVMTDQNPLLTGQYRQQYKNASIAIDASGTYGDRLERTNNNLIETDDDEFRGHAFVDGVWDINNKWRAGIDLELVSDEQYLSTYDFSNEDVLESIVYAERFDSRNYFLGRFIRFKDLRTSDRAEDQPNILPELNAQFIGDPNSVLGGRLDGEVSFLNLAREGNDQDLARTTVKAGWEKKHILPVGLVNNFDLNLRGDLYKANDRDISNTANNRSSDSTATRAFANAQYQASMPFVKNTTKGQVLIEPVGAITLGTKIDENNDDIPNEDSQDAFLDTTNLFDANRFPGYDRIEDGSNATYGFRTGFFTDKGNKLEVFAGQSYRFEEDNNPFPEGSGLTNQYSDYVSSVSINMADNLNLYYTNRMGNDFNAKRHELDLSARYKNLSFSTRYFYANALQQTDLDDEREQIRLGARYDISDEWSVYGAMQYDLAEETEGLRRVQYGVDYTGQCVNLSLAGNRTLTNDFSGDSGTEIMLRLGLKNLGDIETSGLSFGEDSN